MNGDFGQFTKLLYLIASIHDLHNRYAIRSMRHTRALLPKAQRWRLRP